VSTDLPENILTREETLAELKARGLPLELIAHLRKARPLTLRVYWSLGRVSIVGRDQRHGQLG
jgi:hypothetical protein